MTRLLAFSYETLMPLATAHCSLIKSKSGGLLIWFLLIFLNCFAGDFYVASNGSDGNPGTQASPFRTASKASSVAGSGDRVFLQAGGEYYGAISPASGVSFNSYGTGAKPIITGFTTVGAWTSIGGGLYEQVVSASAVNMVVRNGSFQAIGRYPNLGDNTNGRQDGYNIYGSGASTSISSTQSLGSLNFTGGEVVIRSMHWILDRHTINSNTANTISFVAGGYGAGNNNGFGYFIQNHPATLDVIGEWSYTPSTKKITMFFGGGGPGAHVVKVATVANLVTLASKSNVTFTNISFQGSNSAAFDFSGSTNNIVINGCDLLFSGTNGINAVAACHHNSLINSTADWTNNNFINAGTSPNWTITGNTINHTGYVAGMGGSADGKYTGIYDIASNSLVEFNSVKNTGYVAVNFSSISGNGAGVIINKNFLDSFCLRKDDGAGIYTWEGTNPSTMAQRQITNNIVLHGLGAPAGAGGQTNAAFGIYMDDFCSNVTISGNTSALNAGAGIYLHDANNITVNNNTTFGNNNLEIRCFQDVAAYPIRNINMDGNIFFNMNPETASYQNFVLNFRSLTADLAQWGTWNNNYYCRPLTSEQFAITVRQGADFFGTLAQWKSFSGKDANSKSTPVAVTDPSKIRFEYNENKLARVVTLPGNYIDVYGIVYSGHITLAPYSSAILIQTSGTPTTYQSAAKSGSFTRNNCLAGFTGSTVVYSVAAAKYTSTISQSDADSKAVADVSANGQSYANTNGVCTTTPPITYSSVSKSGTFTRNNCPIGQTGSQVTYTVLAGKYTSSVSQADADGQAQGDLNSNGQTYANQNGTCSSPSNLPPTVSAGSDKTISYYAGSCANVTVSSVASDPEGVINSYAWSIVPAVPLANAVSPSITIKGLTKGTYSVVVTVKDSGGLTAFDQMTIMVTEKYCSFWNRLFGQCKCK